MPLFGSVALVFFVACVNVAGLYVARGLQRHREYAMRAALGASRGRMFRQLLTESAALSMVSAVVGAASPPARSRCSRPSADTRFHAQTR